MALPKSVTPPHGFQFEEPEGRPFRLVSVETEVDGDGYTSAGKLYEYGLVDHPTVQPYGYYPGGGSKCVAYMKKDGSVTGGEIVFDRLLLTKPSHAGAMLKAHDLLRGLEKGGAIGYNPNCGGHIHACANGYGFYDLLRLIVNFGYLEEVIFRLAGAGKTYGHRTLYRGYDIANGGGGYSNPVVKGPFGQIAEAYQKITGQPRMSGLNTTIYSGNLCYGCGGAVMVEGARNRFGERSYDLKRCTCNFEKHTIEWRVWNSQGNPRILYAWIAFMQAMHAYAWRPFDDPSYTEYDMIDPLPWTWKPYSRVTQAIKKAAQERVEWIFSELPLTAEEKDALRYTFMRTPFKAFGKDWMKRRADLPYKPPPFPNEYKPPFRVREVTYTEAADARPFEDQEDGPEPDRLPPLNMREQRAFQNIRDAGMRDRPRPRPMRLGNLQAQEAEALRRAREAVWAQPIIIDEGAWHPQEPDQGGN